MYRIEIYFAKTNTWSAYGVPDDRSVIFWTENAAKSFVRELLVRCPYLVDRTRIVKG